MREKITTGIVLIVVSAAIIYRTCRTRRQRGWVLGGCACLLLICLGLMAYQAQRSSQVFSTAESAAEYVCQGDLLGIVDSDASSLVVYKEDASTLNYAIILKTDDGYLIGGPDSYITLAVVSAESGNQDSFYAVILLECPQTGEQYVLVSGTSITVDMSIVSISDSTNSDFTVASTATSMWGGREVSRGYAFAALKGTFSDSYKVTIQNANGETYTSTFIEV